MQTIATSARTPIRATWPNFINAPLLPAAVHGERSLVQEWRLLLVSLFPLLRGHARYPPWQPELVLALCCALRSPHWFGSSTRLAAWLPARGTPQPAPRAASARTQPCAHRRRRYLPSTSRLR